MQIASPLTGSGSEATRAIEHWVFMEQCTPGCACWSDLPGIDGGFSELLDACGIQGAP